MLTRARRILATTPIVMLLAGGGCMHLSPGTLHESSTDPLTAVQRELHEEMMRDVEALAVDIGPRHAGASRSKILEAEHWILEQLAGMGIEGTRDEVDLNGPKVANIEAVFVGAERPSEIVLIGAHYDTVVGSPGANDNASGVALLLATARRLKDASLDRTVRVVFFVNEEAPFTFGLQMGSRIHAERSRARGDDIVAMISVDSVGCYSSEPGSQTRPWFVGGIPSRGNFIVFASNRDHEELVDRVVDVFQAGSRFPSIGIATNMKSVGRSDHAPFWWQGYPALTMSDTSEARDPNYHRSTDTADQLASLEMARMADGFIRMVRSLAAVETRLR